MQITREGIIAYWVSEPEIEPVPENCVCFGRIPFPDIETLSPSERDRLRPVLERNPNYLHEIWCAGRVQ
jgi:hypothetical protein